MAYAIPAVIATRIADKIKSLETFEYIPEFSYIINGLLMRYESNKMFEILLSGLYISKYGQ